MRGGLVAVVLMLTVSSMVVPSASAAIDPGAIGWRIRWVATRDDGGTRVRVRIVFVNGSDTQRFAGDCHAKVWNGDDSVRRAFHLRLRPNGSDEVRFRVRLDGRSPVRADVVACRPS